MKMVKRFVGLLAWIMCLFTDACGYLADSFERIGDKLLRWSFTTLFVLLFFALTILPMPLFYGGTAFAAGSSLTVANDTLIRNAKGEPAIRMIKCSFVADDTDGSIPPLTLDTSSGIRSPVQGWFLYAIGTDGNHVGTEPSEDSDITLLNVWNYDLLGGAGADLLDNTVERFSVLAARVPITDDPGLSIVQQAAAVVNATGDVYLYFLSTP